jgi:hypothetical protein
MLGLRLPSVAVATPERYSMSNSKKTVVIKKREATFRTERGSSDNFRQQTLALGVTMEQTLFGSLFIVQDKVERLVEKREDH